MKKLFTLLVSTGFVFAQTLSFAQTNSDDPIYNNYPVVGKSEYSAISPYYNGMNKAIDSNLYSCAGETVLLTYTSTNCTGYIWSSDSSGSNVLANNTDYTTAPLFNDTTYYITTYNPVGSGITPMPAHSTTYSGNVRGYWFQAPIDFTITAFYVPTEASTGNTNVACVRFNSGAPPLFSTTTNDFTLLGLWQNETMDTIETCIMVNAGDYIGILGNRNDQNSYAPAPNNTTIDGNSVTITRMGMQFPLSTTPPQDLWQESGGSVSRVKFLYSTGVDPLSANVTPVNVTVYPTYDVTINENICQGDSVMVHGSYVSSAGTYVDSSQTVNGCDSTTTVDVVVNSIPGTPTLDSFAQDAICMQGGVIALPNGTPSGGYYSGSGVAGTNFDPSAAGTGTHIITYTYVDTNSCESAPDSTTITVFDCASVDENTLSGVQVYPNPTENTLFIQMPADSDENLNVAIFDATGKQVSFWTNAKGIITFDMTSLSNGLYIVQVSSGQKQARFKVTKK
ncbi:MAG: T9SS type A sorting domain-containing protein [Crocinitomicaceae bacterium]|nr:T9SS type A sorting domain-containing protein [Crocinitomicaceae bacterium]